MNERCEQCKNVPIAEIHNPTEYMLCVGSLARMCLAGEAEIVYQTCPLDQIMDSENRWYAEKIFHQFRCPKCGTIYGMLLNTRTGGQIKINDKVFNPDDYPDKPEKGTSVQ